MAGVEAGPERETQQQAEIAGLRRELEETQHRLAEAAVLQQVTEMTGQPAIQDGRAELISSKAMNALLEDAIAKRIVEMEEMQATLVQSEKMEAIGKLTGGLAHDFNNLQTGITGSLELLQTRLA